MARLSVSWQREQRDKIAELAPHVGSTLAQHLTWTLGMNLAVQWLVVELDRHRIPFKIHNLGAGVKKVTTDTNVCPCCKQKLKG